MKRQETRLDKIRRLAQPENRPVCVLWLRNGNYTLYGQPINKSEIDARYGDDILIIEVEYIEGALV